MNAKTRYLTTGMALLLMGLSLAMAVTLTAPQSARANPGILYAAPDGATSGTCNSWANACTLQYALSRAVSGDEIWVKMGVHYPGAAGNRTATFTLKNGVALYGGFAGMETSRSQRNWQTNITVLSGDIDQNDTDLNGNGIIEPDLFYPRRVAQRGGPGRREKDFHTVLRDHIGQSGEGLGHNAAHIQRPGLCLLTGYGCQKQESVNDVGHFVPLSDHDLQVLALLL